jgi:FkbM family methyltransferase
MKGIAQLKGTVRDWLPARWQVPVKHLYLKACGALEAELGLLPLLIGPGQRALDIGANYGTYAVTLARLGARVDLFEPNPAIAAVLEAWACGRASVVVHAIALSDRSGTAELVIPREGGIEHDSSASIIVGADTRGRRVEVPVVPLDTLGIEDAALIKIDVEGHEDAVLRGAARTIAASAPALIVEIEQRHIARPINTVFAEVLAHGYRGWFLCENALLPLERFDEALHQSPEGFAARSRPYCNNFIFLADTRMANGEYDRFLAQAAG